MSRPRASVALLVASALVLLVAPPAPAHTEVLRAEPAPGEEVTGPVDEVVLTFLDPVLPGAQISVVDDDARPVPGLGAVETSDDGITARVGFDPLDGPGGYVVEYTFTALDGDTQRETYRFTVVASSAPTTTGSSDADGRTWPRLIGPAAVAAALLGALVVAMRRRSADRTSGADVTGPR